MICQLCINRQYAWTCCPRVCTRTKHITGAQATERQFVRYGLVHQLQSRIREFPVVRPFVMLIPYVMSDPSASALPAGIHRLPAALCLYCLSFVSFSALNSHMMQNRGAWLAPMNTGMRCRSVYICPFLVYNHSNSQEGVRL